MRPEIMPLGDRALLVNFQQKIDYQIHGKVMDLCHQVKAASIAGVTFVLPCYCSLTIGYHPQLLTYVQLKQIILDLLKKPAEQLTRSGRNLTLPVCYQEPCAPDLAEVIKHTGLTSDQVIGLHCEKAFRVFMMGFLPGFPYLGILPKALQVPRKDNPRLQVAERSVGIAGLQTGIYPFQSPGGWNIIGKTPLPMFNSMVDDNFLMRVGDQVKFRPIDLSEYREIRESVETLTFDWDTIYDQDV